MGIDIYCVDTDGHEIPGAAAMRVSRNQLGNEWPNELAAILGLVDEGLGVSGVGGEPFRPRIVGVFDYLDVMIESNNPLLPDLLRLLAWLVENPTARIVWSE